MSDNLKVGMISLGCPKNQVDAEEMLGCLAGAGFTPTPRAAEADLLVVHTCGFIGPAKRESVEAILEAARWKREGRCRALVVTGCLAQRYRGELGRELPEVDAFLGTGELGRVGEVARDLLGLTGPCAPSPGRVRTTPPHVAYLKLAEGCDNRCSYCVIPALRGRLASRPPEEVLAEAEKLAASGARELILIAQDTTAYGRDLGLPDALAELLRRLSRLEVDWLRLLYAHPRHLSPALIDALRGPKVVPYLDLPLQHIADPLLRAMGRGVTRREVERKLDELRRAVPGITLRTSFIVGFPGEGAAEVAELAAFLEEQRFHYAGFFAYSREEGTPAAALPRQVSARETGRRLRRLERLQAQIGHARRRELVGRQVRVLVDQPSPENPGWFVGRTPGDAPDVDGSVYLPGEGLRPGRLVLARVLDAHGYDLVAEAGEEGAEVAG